jgi:hypothetical protein
MTIPLLEVSFNRMFEYGQAYVALSRATSLAGLTLRQYQSNVIKAHPLVKKFYEKLYRHHTLSNQADEICQVTLQDFVDQFSTLDTSYDNEQWLESRNNPYNKSLTSSGKDDDNGWNNIKSSGGSNTNKHQFDEFKFLEGSDFDPKKLLPRKQTGFISPETPATFLPGKLAQSASSTYQTSGFHRSVTNTSAPSSSSGLSGSVTGRVVTGRVNSQVTPSQPLQTYLPIPSSAAGYVESSPVINQNPVQQLPLSDDLKR